MNYEKLVGRKWNELSEEEQCLFYNYFSIEEIEGKSYLLLLDDDEEDRPKPLLKIELNTDQNDSKNDPYEDYFKECQEDGEEPLDREDFMDLIHEDKCCGEDIICDAINDIDPNSIVEKY